MSYSSAEKQSVYSTAPADWAIDTSVQKGGVPGMPGVIEHTGVITQLLKEAKTNKGDMAVLWLDLKNAYGSIPHSLVQEALKRYHVPNKIIEIITTTSG